MGNYLELFLHTQIGLPRLTVIILYKQMKINSQKTILKIVEIKLYIGREREIQFILFYLN